MRERPLAALHFFLFRHAELEQMSDRRRQDIAIALVVVVVARKATERARDIGGDGRLFGNDQTFRHGNFRQKRTPILPKVRDRRQEIVRMRCFNARARARALRARTRGGVEALPLPAGQRRDTAVEL